MFFLANVMICSTRSFWRVQQKQPFCMAMTSSLWTKADWSIRLLSMFRAAMSLTMTAHLKSSLACLVSKICLSRVVLPAPRNPHRRVTGKSFSWSTSFPFEGPAEDSWNFHFEHKIKMILENKCTISKTYLHINSVLSNHFDHSNSKRPKIRKSVFTHVDMFCFLKNCAAETLCTAEGLRQSVCPLSSE